MTLKIGLIQMCSSNSWDLNRRKIESLLENPDLNSSDLILLPENFACMQNSREEKIEIQENHNEGPVQEWIKSISKKFGIWLVAGSFPISSQVKGKPFARCLVSNPDGEFEAHYDKIHLFDVEVAQGESYFESEDTQSGDSPQIIEVKGVKIGLSICYDVRFPELYRDYQQSGVQLVLVPSAFTFNTGKLHWDTLLSARAIENLFYVAAANQTGTHPNGRATYGHSQIVDPWGKVMVQLDSNEGFITADIDVAHLSAIRNSFPSHNHRKL